MCLQSTRRYEASPVIVKMCEEMESEGKPPVIYEKPITLDTKVCLIGDGQGADTLEFLKMGVLPENIASINVEPEEIQVANNKTLKGTGVVMKEGDVTNIDDLHKAGIEDRSQDVVVMMHVLEVPDIKGGTEKRLIENLSRILKPGGEALVSQYRDKLPRKEAVKKGVEEIKEEDLKQRFGKNWKDKFFERYGRHWYRGMLFSEISNIRLKEDLQALFEDHFDIKMEETGSEYVLRMRRKE